MPLDLLINAAQVIGGALAFAIPTLVIRWLLMEPKGQRLRDMFQ